jgi:hypothetical protein
MDLGWSGEAPERCLHKTWGSGKLQPNTKFGRRRIDRFLGSSRTLRAHRYRQCTSMFRWLGRSCMSRWCNRCRPDKYLWACGRSTHSRNHSYKYRNARPGWVSKSRRDHSLCRSGSCFLSHTCSLSNRSSTSGTRKARCQDTRNRCCIRHTCMRTCILGSGGSDHSCPRCSLRPLRNLWGQLSAHTYRCPTRQHLALLGRASRPAGESRGLAPHPGWGRLSRKRLQQSGLKIQGANDA